MSATNTTSSDTQFFKEKFKAASLHRPYQFGRYDAGQELTFNLIRLDREGVAEKEPARFIIEKFVGGGFAGQVYKVKLLSIAEGSLPGLVAGQSYAMKILIPPSGFSLWFRNLLYFLGFQGAFQLQVNPYAAKSGALWQKFIRRGAKLRFGRETAVNDIKALFMDKRLGSCGEITDWIDGRTWHLEVDDRLDALKLWMKGRRKDDDAVGSPEFRSKRRFMNDFVQLLKDMGAHEFARQYEWFTFKSQPNCLKLSNTEDDPEAGLVAVDFRAGLTLLPFLPMSPGDMLLILKGIARGSLIQFDRGDLKKLRSFIEKSREEFNDLLPLLDDLEKCEAVYRNSIIDITHHHFKLLFNPKLWLSILSGAMRGWHTDGSMDDKTFDRLQGSFLIPLFVMPFGGIPFLGKVFRKFLLNQSWRSHYLNLANPLYFIRSVKGKMAEKALGWYRDERLSPGRARRAATSFPAFAVHLPFSFLPIGIHKFFTSFDYFKDRLHYLLLRPVKLYFNAGLREEWLNDMVEEGKKKHILDDKDAGIILSKIKEPFIQKYLKSLAVHVCTLPVTQVISVAIAIAYVLMHPEMPRAQSWGIGLGIIALFQVTPISPGSFTRGAYVLFLVIKERNFKDYNIAVFLAFFKYIGYLAFPIQMTYKYPELARFMAGHWATEAVHVVPVFGERGALLEHWIFRLFYNWPLTIRRRMTERYERLKNKSARAWHVLPIAMLTAGIFLSLEIHFPDLLGREFNLKDYWYISFVLPFLSGCVLTLLAAGMSLKNRILLSILNGVLIGTFYTAASRFILLPDYALKPLLIACAWRGFAFAAFSTIGTILTEIKIPDPELKKAIKSS